VQGEEGAGGLLIDFALGKPGAENRSSGQVAARVTEIVQAAYASAQSERLMDISPPPGSNPTGAHDPAFDIVGGESR
jgi:hypothetical protein